MRGTTAAIVGTAFAFTTEVGEFATTIFALLSFSTTFGSRLTFSRLLVATRMLRTTLAALRTLTTIDAMRAPDFDQFWFCGDSGFWFSCNFSNRCFGRNFDGRRLNSCDFFNRCRNFS